MSYWLELAGCHCFGVFGEAVAPCFGVFGEAVIFVFDLLLGDTTSSYRDR
jgi:hypothetical protein